MGGTSQAAQAASPAPYGVDHTGRPVSKSERDAWNKQRARTGLSGQALKNKLDQDAAAQQQAAMFSMFDMGGGLHTPSFGPSEEEIEADRLTTGINDLNSAYDAYLGASQDATSIVNDKISKERSNAALLGLDFSVDDARKSELISDEFANMFTSQQYSDLTKLNDEFGQSRIDQGDGLSAFEFLVQRGAATGADEETTAAGAPKTNAAGGTTLPSLLDDTETKAFNALGA